MFSRDELLNRIEINPKIMAGKPVIKGTRIPVQQVLRLLAQGILPEEIMHNYEVMPQDIFACLLYATEMLEKTSIIPITESKPGLHR